MHRLKHFDFDTYTTRVPNGRLFQSWKPRKKTLCCLFFLCFLCLMFEHTMLINFQSLTDVSSTFIKCLSIISPLFYSSPFDDVVRFLGDENHSQNPFHQLNCIRGSVVVRVLLVKTENEFLQCTLFLSVVIYFTACRLMVEHSDKNKEKKTRAHRGKSVLCCASFPYHMDSGTISSLLF